MKTVFRATGSKRDPLRDQVVNIEAGEYVYRAGDLGTEMFIILEGEGIYRFGDQRYPIKAGSVLGAPAGGQDTAHQIINTGTTPLRYYGISTMSLADVCEYPDSGKFGVFSRHTRNPYDHSTIRHLQHLDHKGVDYWDGEPGSEEGKTK